MDEQVEIFRTNVMGIPAFDNAIIVLMLNKIDLFEEKLKKTKFGSIYKKYSGANNAVDAAAYVTNIYKGPLTLP